MKRKYYLLILTLLLSISSCKDFLDTLPTDFLAPETYYTTEAQLNYARAGVYHTLGAGQLYGTWGNYLFGWAGDEGYMNRATLVVGPWRYNFSSSEPYSSGYWSNLYNGINRANVLLANLDNNPSISQEYRDQIRGEIMFLRGYYYFMLVQYYGGVPLKLTPTTSVQDVDIARASTREVYDQILKDMEAAEPLVKSIKSLGFGGQVNKSAVRGILARVNLHMAGYPLRDASRYPEARKWAKMVMDDAEAGHDLNPNYAQVFINYASDVYDIKESLWEVEFWGNRTDEYTESGFVGYINGPSVSANASAKNGFGRSDAYMSITSKLYNSYEPGDMRKFWNVAFMSFHSTTGVRNNLGESTTEAAKFSRLPGKWRREYEKLLPKFPNQTPINMPILRFSDVLLMFAEAENAISGPTPAAIEAVNKVRRRGYGVGGIKSITVTNGGSGYTSDPTVSFQGGGSSAAAVATASITDNSVSVVNLSRDPMNVTFNLIGKYNTAPTVAFTGGGGTGAAATVKLYTNEDAEAPVAQIASPEAFLQLIQNERLRELNFEGLRKADLLRWGIFVDAMQDVGNVIQQHAANATFLTAFTNVTQKHLLWPIPANEINTNLKMVQNPGWE